MLRRSRRNHSPTFKVEVVLAAIKGRKMLREPAQLYGVHTAQIAAWKAQSWRERPAFLAPVRCAIARVLALTSTRCKRGLVLPLDPMGG
jgi:transposase-like protein